MLVESDNGTGIESLSVSSQSFLYATGVQGDCSVACGNDKDILGGVREGD
jgi:hypothetical protein